MQKSHIGFEPKISLDEATKSTNSQTNIKSPGNDCLIVEVYKHFSNELSLLLLDVYNSREKSGILAQKALDTIIDKNQLAAMKNKTILIRNLSLISLNAVCKFVLS